MVSDWLATSRIRAAAWCKLMLCKVFSTAQDAGFLAAMQDRQFCSGFVVLQGKEGSSHACRG